MATNLKVVQRTGEEKGRVFTRVMLMIPTPKGHGPNAGVILVIDRPGDPNEVLYFSDGNIEVSADE